MSKFDDRSPSSTRSRRKTRRLSIKEAKAEQGYEDSHPSCSDCSYRRVPHLVNKVYVAPICGLGMFPVRSTGICDHWTGKNGDTLV
jgi:hypothetical protein